MPDTHSIFSHCDPIGIFIPIINEELEEVKCYAQDQITSTESQNKNRSPILKAISFAPCYPASLMYLYTGMLKTI